MKIYLTRHGETEWNREKRMQGRMDSPLTEWGKKQALLLAQRLADQSFDAVYSSPSPRAVQTAEIIRGERGIVIQQDPALFEMDLGSWEGKTQMEVQEAEPERYRLFWEDPTAFVPDHGEDFATIERRVVSFLSKLSTKHQNETVLIVSHAVVVKILLCHVMKRNLKQLWHDPYIHGGSLTIITQNEQGYMIELLADCSHLEEKREN
jgi:probable phosphoglycerate mutase